jgi:hypothetical protein
MRWAHTWIAALALSVAASCSGTATCKADRECGSGFVCAQSTCVEGCHDSSQCPSGQTCVATACPACVPCPCAGGRCEAAGP